MLYNRAKFLQSVTFNDQKQKTPNSTSQLKKNENELSQKDIESLKLREQIVSDISHPRIRQMIFKHKSVQQLLKGDKIGQRKQQYQNNLTNLQLLQQRKWLSKKGKKYLIDFDDNQRKQMKSCFNAMDINAQGSIGIDQLQQLLLSVGLMESREEVKQLIDSVDQDKSGKIQFAEFLKMILNQEGQNQQIVQFFKTIINQNQLKNKKTLLEIYQNKKKPQISNKNNKNIIKKKISLLADKENPMPLLIQKKSSKDSRLINRSYQMNKHFIDFEKNKNSALKIFDKHPHPKNLPFGMIVSHIRRKHMMTALKIGQHQISLSRFDSSNNKSELLCNKQNNKSNQNIKQIFKTNNYYDQEDVNKGQNVMNALKKMWDRRLLRKIRESRRIEKINLLKKENTE